MSPITTVSYSDDIILSTLTISEPNIYGAVSIESRLGEAWIQDHIDIFLVDGVFGTKRVSSLEEGIEYVKSEYLKKYKKLLQF